MRRVRVLLAALLLATTACADGATDLLAPNSGGEATVNVSNRNAFALPLPALSEEERAKFTVGDSFFTEPWEPAIGTDQARDGLGPLYDAISCEGCHVRDGRGAPPNDAGIPPGVIYRIGIRNDFVADPVPGLGTQLQQLAIDGVEPKGSVTVSFEETAGEFADGTGYILRSPTYTIEGPEAGRLGDVVVSLRVAPVIAGAGLLEAVPRDTIEALADPLDSNDDGISGQMNAAPSTSDGDVDIGRFGWKAATALLRDQAAIALHRDLGITSPLFVSEDCSGREDCLRSLNGGTPEIDDTRLDLIVFYAATLAVPARRGLEAEEVRQGAVLFDNLGCSACHTPTLETGPHRVPALSHQTIHPYTDLLLHDMGPGLADNFPEGIANGSEWRTPPLWGIGLVERVNGHTYFLHDGRARSLEEAILWHGGEGHATREAYKALDARDRTRLIAFLRSL